MLLPSLIGILEPSLLDLLALLKCHPLMDIECIFCDIFAHKDSALPSLKWYDIPVMQSDDFIAVPALGQIVPGYLLIAPREHVFSMAQLARDSRKKLYRFVEQVQELQASLWDKPTVFEHGACRESRRAGACINHAHWHLVPGKWDLLPLGTRSEEYPSFEEFVEQTIEVHPYLLVIDQESRCRLADGINVPSQYLRRLLAAIVGKPSEWDYLASPFFENIEQTLDRVRNKNLSSSVTRVDE